MAIRIIKSDFQLVNYAYNNNVLIFDTTSNIAKVTITKLWHNHSGKSDEFTTLLTDKGKRYKIDISKIIQSSFSFEDYDVNPLRIDSHVMPVYNSSALFNLRIESGRDGYEHKLFFLRAAKQLGEKYGSRFYYMHVGALDCFDGYPFSISFVMFGDDPVELIKFNYPTYYAQYHKLKAVYDSTFRTVYAGVNEFFPRMQVDPSSNYPFKIGHNRYFITPAVDDRPDFGLKIHRYGIDIWRHIPKTCNGLYLRWLNYMGGWDHHLFENWEVSRSLKTRGRFEIDYENLGVKSTLFERGMDAMDSITLHSSHLEEYQKRKINTLFDSPKVRLYIGEPGKTDINPSSRLWIDCYVGNKKVKILNSNEVKYDIEVEILKPKKYTLTI